MTLDELTKAIAGARERANLIGSDADASKVSGAEYMSAAYQRVWEDRKALLAVIDQLMPDARRMEWVITEMICHGRIRHSDLPITDTSAAGIRPAIDRAIEGEQT